MSVRRAILGLAVATGMAASGVALAQSTGAPGSAAPGASDPTGGMPTAPHQQNLLRPVPDAAGKTIAPSGGGTTSDPAVTVSPGAGGPTGTGTMKDMPVTPHQGQAVAPGGKQTH